MCHELENNERERERGGSLKEKTMSEKHRGRES
jgi:hypothetical protein